MMSSKHIKLAALITAIILLASTGYAFVRSYIHAGLKTVIIDDGENGNVINGYRPLLKSVKVVKPVVNTHFCDWLGDMLIYYGYNNLDREKNGIYIYDVEKDTHQLFKNFETWLFDNPRLGVSKDKTKLLMYQRYSESEVNNNSLPQYWEKFDLKHLLEVYDDDTKSCSTIEKWTVRTKSTAENRYKDYKIDFADPLPQDGQNLYYILKENENKFKIVIYNIRTQQKEYYAIDNREKSYFPSGFQISNDGKSLWFIGTKITYNNDPFSANKIDSNLYRVEIDNINMDAKKILNDVRQFYISSDGNTLIYTNYDQSKMKENLMVIDTRNKQSNIISSEDSIRFDVFPDKNRIAYVTGNKESSDLYIAQIDEHGVVSNDCIYKFGDNMRLENIKLNKSGNEIAGLNTISYAIKKNGALVKVDAETKIYIFELD